MNDRDVPPPSYLYPSVDKVTRDHAKVTKKSSLSNKINTQSQLERTISADLDKAFIPRKEEEIKPKLVRPRNLEAHFKQIMADKRYEFQDDGADVDQRDKEHRSSPENAKTRADWKNEKNRGYHEPSKGLTRTKSNPMKELDSTGKGYYPSNGKQILPPQPSNSPPPLCEYSDDDDLDERYRYRENLTDRQKYRESLAMEKHRQVRQHEREQIIEKPRERDHSHSRHNRHADASNDRYPSGRSGESHSRYHDDNGATPHNYNERERDIIRNPYKEPESLPYRESIERMIKSPAMRYKSFEGGINGTNNKSGHNQYEYEHEHEHRHNSPGRHSDGRYHSHAHPSASRNGDVRPRASYERHDRHDRDYSHSPPVMYGIDDNSHMSRHRYRQPTQRSMSRSPDMKMSPNGRYDARDNNNEKFHSLERDLAYSMEKVNHARRIDTDTLGARSNNSGRNNNNHQQLLHQRAHREPSFDYMSSEEDDGYRHRVRGDDNGPRAQEHFEKNPNARMASSKSLGNLVKGYRHSYAEPRAPMPRNSGRVGLAAVNPF